MTQMQNHKLITDLFEKDVSLFIRSEDSPNSNSDCYCMCNLRPIYGFIRFNLAGIVKREWVSRNKLMQGPSGPSKRKAPFRTTSVTVRTVAWPLWGPPIRGFRSIICNRPIEDRDIRRITDRCEVRKGRTTTTRYHFVARGPARIDCIAARRALAAILATVRVGKEGGEIAMMHRAVDNPEGPRVGGAKSIFAPPLPR